MTKIFLGGGGSESDSLYLDKRFVSMLDLEKPVFYIPVAMKSRPYSECLEWFTSIMSPLGVKKIEMITNLEKVNENELNSSCGIYIGGGDTTKLITEIHKSGFDKRLLSYINTERPTYGGSAGAIILGADVRTAPESKDLDDITAKGLNVLSGYSVHAHYDARKVNIQQLFEKNKQPIIAISEHTGVYVENNLLEVIGSEDVKLINNKGITAIKPGRKVQL